MKALLLIFVTLAFVPFALSLRNFPSPSVVDSEGKALQVGTSYYAVSVSVSTAYNFQEAGICLVDLKNQTLREACPHDVVQSPILNNNNKPNLGFPITFQSDLNTTVAEPVKEGTTSYNIRFPVTAVGLLCIKDVFWGLADDGNMFRKFVTTNPAAAAAKFTVQRDGLGYRIAYCESIPVCYGVGFIQDGANSRLGIGVDVKSIQFFFTKYDGTALHTHYATS